MSISGTRPRMGSLHQLRRAGIVSVLLALAASLIVGVTANAASAQTLSAAQTPSAAQLQSRINDISRPLQARIDDELALAPGGVQISSYEIAWRGGKVVMAFPATGQAEAATSSARALGAQPAKSAVALAIHGCPTVITGNDWYCFYADSNWGGRRLQWSDQYCSYISFGDYGFANQASSWVNGGGFNVWAYNGTSTSKTTLWYEDDHTQSSYVGAANNDKADYFQSC